MEMSQKLGKHQTSSDIDRPCYQKLYQYIAAVLLGKEVPKLTQIGECIKCIFRTLYIFVV